MNQIQYYDFMLKKGEEISPSFQIHKSYAVFQPSLIKVEFIIEIWLN